MPASLPTPPDLPNLLPGAAMAYPGQQYMVPMFPIPQVTWASNHGSTSVGKFPNPRSVLRICELPSYSP